MAEVVGVGLELGVLGDGEVVVEVVGVGGRALAGVVVDAFVAEPAVRFGVAECVESLTFFEERLAELVVASGVGALAAQGAAPPGGGAGRGLVGWAG